jgi:septal ring factor EnvC (AmiA/AmiB activator)
MVNSKIEKVKTEIEKTKAKLTELQAKLRELEREKTRLENEEIIALVRGGDPAALARLGEFISDAELYTLKKPTAAAKTSEIKVSETITVKEDTENANIAEN